MDFSAWPAIQVEFVEPALLDKPSKNYPNVHFRHSGTANVSFLDGRVDLDCLVTLLLATLVLGWTMELDAVEVLGESGSLVMSLA